MTKNIEQSKKNEIKEWEKNEKTIQIVQSLKIYANSLIPKQNSDSVSSFLVFIMDAMLISETSEPKKVNSHFSLIARIVDH